MRMRIGLWDDITTAGTTRRPACMGRMAYMLIMLILKTQGAERMDSMRYTLSDNHISNFHTRSPCNLPSTRSGLLLLLFGRSSSGRRETHEDLEGIVAVQCQL